MFDTKGEMPPRHLFDQNLLDEIEGEALTVLENPELYAAMTVDMAERTLEMVARLRGQPQARSA